MPKENQDNSEHKIHPIEFANKLSEFFDEFEIHQKIRKELFNIIVCYLSSHDKFE